MSEPLSGKPDNYLDDPDALLREARRQKAKATQPLDSESPPAGRPPNYSWRPKAVASGSPAALTDRVVYASAFHHQSSEEPTKLKFSPVELSPSAPEKTVIDLHFKKLLGHIQTPHPPGYLPQDTPLAKQSTSTTTGITLASDLANTMSREEDAETIRALQSQVQSLELRTAELDQSRQETAELQKMVRELLAERAESRSPGNPPPVTEEDQGEGDEPSGSNTFSRYVHHTPTSPSPMPRNQQSTQPSDTLQQPVSDITRNHQPATNFAPHQRVSWAEEIPTNQPRSRTQPVQSTPAIFGSRPVNPSPLGSIYSPAGPVARARTIDSHANRMPTLETPNTTTADKVKLSDLPKFSGKFGKPADLFHWRSLIEETFEIKNVVDDREKLKLLGSLLNIEEMLAWYQSNKE